MGFSLEQRQCPHSWILSTLCEPRLLLKSDFGTMNGNRSINVCVCVPTTQGTCFSGTAAIWNQATSLCAYFWTKGRDWPISRHPLSHPPAAWQTQLGCPTPARLVEQAGVLPQLCCTAASHTPGQAQGHVLLGVLGLSPPPRVHTPQLGDCCGSRSPPGRHTTWSRRVPSRARRDREGSRDACASSQGHHLMALWLTRA